MSNSLSNELLAQIYCQESDDPFLTLVTLSHSSFSSDIRLVNNSENVISRGNTFLSFPMRIRLPADDGETAREAVIDFDNVSLELIEEFRSVTGQIDVTVEMVLASIPDEVQISLDELKIQSITYTQTLVTARIILDNFLNTELTSERYTPSNFAGLF